MSRIGIFIYGLVWTIAIQLEERDLVSAFGRDYVAYRRRTPMLMPRLWPRRTTIAASESQTRT